MPPGLEDLDEFPRQYARTKRFTLGVPRTFTVAPDGERVLFLRSRAGDDPVNALWRSDVPSGEEQLLFDPRASGAAGEEPLSDAERDRRERVGERARGITAYSTDAEVRLAVFGVGARLVLVDVVTGESRELGIAGVPDDPRLDPTGRRIAYVVDRGLRVLDLEGGDRVMAAEDDPNITWGLAEFVAAEEMERYRGHWWSPDGERLVAARVDVTPVQRWYITDPTDPETPSRPIRYPRAGTDDAIVTLHVFDVRTGDRNEVRWDRGAFPYLARVDWSENAPLTLLVVSRDQRRAQLLEVEPGVGTTTLAEIADPEWVDLPVGAPTRTADGRIVSIRADRGSDTYRLVVGGEDATDAGWDVHSVLDAADDVLFTATDVDVEPAVPELWRWSRDGSVVPMFDEPGIHTGVGAGSVTVRVSATLREPLPETVVLRDGVPVGRIGSNAERPLLEARPRFMTLGERRLRAALLLPGGRDPDATLPVLMDPYGGPHLARVTPSQAAHLTSQWFADRLGVAVLVVDGRGTPGRGPAWERAVVRDFTVALEDQVDAVHAAAEELGFLDLSQVAMRGWSFGGYLSAMAVLRRPEVFHAAIAGAPVTDWRLYDTYYTERYLGRPQDEPETYRRNSLIEDAATLERPLLLIHGLADDNVVVAHSLRLSAELFEHGRHHELALLPAATHRSTSEDALLLLELGFLRRWLRVPPGS